MKAISLILTLLFAIFASATSTTMAVETVDVERDALMALYNSTDGANWNDNTDWGTANPHCTWFGVGCDAGNVAVLHLFTNQLNGSIPPEIANLSSLRVLHLGTNLLSGPIPPELGNLSSLGFLDLRRNQLSGPIPAELGNLSNLYSLVLAYNPSLVCWQSEAALLWALSLNINPPPKTNGYWGPVAVCSFVYLPEVTSAGG